MLSTHSSSLRQRSRRAAWPRPLVVGALDRWLCKYRKGRLLHARPLHSPRGRSTHGNSALPPLPPLPQSANGQRQYRRFAPAPQQHCSVQPRPSSSLSASRVVRATAHWPTSQSSRRTRRMARRHGNAYGAAACQSTSSPAKNTGTAHPVFAPPRHHEALLQSPRPPLHTPDGPITGRA